MDKIWTDMKMIGLTEKIKKLEEKVDELERFQAFRGQFWSLNEGRIELHAGNATLTLKKDGSIILKGRDIEIDATGNINIKGAGNVNIRGAKITEN